VKKGMLKTILGAVLVSALMLGFSPTGCVPEAPPEAPPEALPEGPPEAPPEGPPEALPEAPGLEVPLAAVKLEVTSHTWREGEEPYDIYTAIKGRLEEAGIDVTSEVNADYDALLLVDYEETKGGEYGFEEAGVGMGIYGTRIMCALKLRDKKDNPLWEYDIETGTSYQFSSTVGPYGDAINNFESHSVFRYLGDLVSIRLGMDVTVFLDTLIADLQSPDSEVRGDAANVLGVIDDERIDVTVFLDTLIAGLQSPDWEVRGDAAKALGVIGDERAVDPLIHILLDDDNINVVAAVIRALGNIGDERAVDPLIITFDEYERRFSWELPIFLHSYLGTPIAVALGRIGGDRAIEALIGTFLQHEDDAVRKCAAEALGNIGDERAIEPLTVALEDSHPLVQEAAAEALEKIRQHKE